MALLAPWFWWADNATHFRWQYCLFLTPAVALWVYQRRWAHAAVGAIALFWHLSLIVPLYLGDNGVASPFQPTLTLVVLNVHTPNTRYAEVARFLSEANADVTILLEINGRWARELSAWSSTMAMRQEVPSEDNFGIGLYSSREGAAVVANPLDENETKSLAARVPFSGSTIDILAVHPLPPVSTRGWAQRNRVLADAAIWAKERPSCLVAGDFNCTPWSPFFGRFIEAGRLQDARRGHGVVPSWPAGAPLLGIPIDSVVTGERLRVVSMKRGPDLGSDHYPVIVTLQRAP
jgi:endonuclease/exonuclease/phosphatase (EEP) superfamily protein YafD